MIARDRSYSIKGNGPLSTKPWGQIQREWLSLACCVCELPTVETDTVLCMLMEYSILKTFTFNIFESHKDNSSLPQTNKFCCETSEG